MHTDATPIDTLRMPEGEITRMLDQLDCISNAQPPHPLRQCDRYAYRPGKVSVTISHLGGSTATFLASPRNISANGVSFLLGLFIHHGSRATVSLKLADGESILVTGTVARCRFLQSRAHEIVVLFDEAINPELFINTPEACEARRQAELKAQAAARPPPSFQGNALILDDFNLSRRIMRHHLEKLGLGVHEAEEFSAADQAVEKSRFDLVIVDKNLREASGLDFVRKLRGQNFRSPILLWSSEDSDAVQVMATEAGCNGFISKTADPAVMMQTIEQLLQGCRRKTWPPIRSSLADDPDFKPLIAEFIGAIGEHGNAITTALDQQNEDSLRTICLNLKGTAAALGFPDLVAAAPPVLTLLENKPADWQNLPAAIGHLLDIIGRLSL